MNASAPQALLRITLGSVLAVSLAACEIRQTTGGEEGAAADETAETLATPTPTQTPAASIIREDVESVAEPVAPPPPLELVLPFPEGADLSPRAERLLQDVLTSEALAEGWPVTLGGHTDSGGNDQANLRSSRARAEAVAAWLVEQGVADERITVIAFGEQNPIAPNALPDGNSNEEGRRANRRVELRIAPPNAPAPTPSPTGATSANGA